jgi:hypothetical protein
MAVSPTNASVGRTASLRDIRRALRQLPPDRRKDVVAAIRAGREVRDSRDAGLAVAWAERLEGVHWPRWVMPRSRPRGRSGWLWLLHIGWIVVATIGALITLWSILHGTWRWVAVGLYAYSAITAPLTLARTLRTYWNAPEAAEKNRKLLTGP